MRAARVVDLIAGRLGVVKPIVFVSGFWRSGTTWLQEMLASSFHAKTVFEPICPQNRAWKQHLLAAGVRNPDLQEAFIPGRTHADDPMWRYLDAAFLATANSPLSTLCRGSITESFRRAIVVKEVRLQLNLAVVHRRYGVGVVHLRRHPCAVVSSLMSAKWGWSFDRVRLADLVAPFIGDLRADCMPGMETLAQFDVDTVSRTAAFWAITERLTDRTVRGQPWAAVMAYEDAVLDPECTIHDIGRLIGRRPSLIANPDFDSASTQRASRGIPPKLRPHTWRSRLSGPDIERIYGAVETIFPEALAQLRDDAA